MTVAIVASYLHACLPEGHVATRDGVTTRGSSKIVPVAPGVFTLNSDGLVAARVVRTQGGRQIFEEVFALTGSTIAPRPIDLGPPGDEVYLLIYGTGIRHAKSVAVTIGGIQIPQFYVGPSADAGADQLNVGPLPKVLEGRGVVPLVVMADGIGTNRAIIQLR